MHLKITISNPQFLTIIKRHESFWVRICLICCLELIPLLAFGQKSYDDVYVSKVPNRNKLLGIGVEFDPFFFSHNTVRDDGPTIFDWNKIIIPRVKSMRIQRYRTMLLPHWWEPENDNDDPFVIDDSRFTWDSYDMQSLYKVLDLAEQTNADVNLVLWGCPNNSPSLATGTSKLKYINRYFMAEKGRHWVTGPKDANEFAECFVALLRYLLEIKKYTCVKEITPFNEPESSVISTEGYIKVCRALDEMLKLYGIRDRVKIVVSDNIDANVWFLKAVADSLGNIADVFDSHAYSFGYEQKNSQVIEWESNNNCIIANTGKAHFIGEFGSNMVKGAARQLDIDCYERGVLLVRNVINFLNSGAVAASYWRLYDEYLSAESVYGR